MGAIIEILGDCTIPPEKGTEFRNCMLHVLDIGGMMRLEEVCKYGKSAILMAIYNNLYRTICINHIAVVKISA